MTCSNSKDLISKTSSHAIKKCQMIEKFKELWAQKPMLKQYCSRICFIDCMRNSGLYHDENGVLSEGTHIRVAKVLGVVASQYPLKQVHLYLSDIDQDTKARKVMMERGILPC